MFSGFFGYLIGGLVIGVLARLIKPGADPMGWMATILLGVGGAAIGGWASSSFGLGTLLTWAVAIAAAIGLIFVYEIVAGKRKIR